MGRLKSFGARLDHWVCDLTFKRWKVEDDFEDDMKATSVEVANKTNKPKTTTRWGPLTTIFVDENP